MKKVCLLAIATLIMCNVSAQKEATMAELLTKPMLDKCNVFTSSIPDIKKELNNFQDITKRMDFFIEKGDNSISVSNAAFHGCEYLGSYVNYLLINSEEGSRLVVMTLKTKTPEILQALKTNIPQDLKALGFVVKKENENSISYMGDKGYDYLEIYYFDNKVKISYDFKEGTQMPSF